MNVCKINVLTLYASSTILIMPYKASGNSTPQAASQKHQRQEGKNNNEHQHKNERL